MAFLLALLTIPKPRILLHHLTKEILVDVDEARLLRDDLKRRVERDSSRSVAKRVESVLHCFGSVVKVDEVT